MNLQNAQFNVDEISTGLLIIASAFDLVQSYCQYSSQIVQYIHSSHFFTHVRV